MRSYIIRKIEHLVYEDVTEIPETIQFTQDWRKAKVGEWVMADDGCAIQILRRGKMLNQGRYPLDYIGTCTGTFICRKNSSMDTNKRKNIYSFSGKKGSLDAVKERKNITGQEMAFAKYISVGISPEDAYKKAFGASNKRYSKIRSGILLKTERIVAAIDKQLDDVFEDLCIDLKYLIGRAKDFADNDDIRASDSIAALKMLWEAKGVTQKEKNTQITGAVFQGFGTNELKPIEEIKKLGGRDAKIEE